MEGRDQLGAAVVEDAAAQARDRILRLQQRPRGERAQRDDDLRLDRGELAEQERLARRDLVGLRIAVARRPALEHVGDVDLVALEAHRLDHLRQQLAGAPDERDALHVFIRARRFADEHQVRRRVADAEDDLLPPERVQLAARAVADVLADRRQQLHGRARERDRHDRGVVYAIAGSAGLQASPRIADLKVGPTVSLAIAGLKAGPTASVRRRAGATSRRG